MLRRFGKREGGWKSGGSGVHVQMNKKQSREIWDDKDYGLLVTNKYIVKKKIFNAKYIY